MFLPILIFSFPGRGGQIFFFFPPSPIRSQTNFGRFYFLTNLQKNTPSVTLTFFFLGGLFFLFMEKKSFLGEKKARGDYSETFQRAPPAVFFFIKPGKKALWKRMDGKIFFWEGLPKKNPPLL